MSFLPIRTAHGVAATTPERFRLSAFGHACPHAGESPAPLVTLRVEPVFSNISKESIASQLFEALREDTVLFRGPQSEQSVPYWQSVYAEPGPPSSQMPSEAH